MITRYQKAAEAGGTEEKETHKAGEPHTENCRCKEASRMTPAELLKLMINDLAFWKKDKSDSDK